MSLTGQELIVGGVIMLAVAYLAWRALAMLKRRGGCGSCGACDEKSPAAKPLVQLDSLPKQPQTP